MYTVESLVKQIQDDFSSKFDNLYIRSGNLIHTSFRVDQPSKYFKNYTRELYILPALFALDKGLHDFPTRGKYTAEDFNNEVLYQLNHQTRTLFIGTTSTDMRYLISCTDDFVVTIFILT